MDNKNIKIKVLTFELNLKETRTGNKIESKVTFIIVKLSFN